MLAVASSPIGFQLSRAQSTAALGTIYERNHCLPSRSGIPSATTTQRASELPDPQPNRPETRKPASTETDFARGKRDAHRATGPSPNTSCFTSAEAAFETTKAVVAHTERHHP